MLKGFYQGYKNALLKNDLQVEELSKKRLKVCEGCPLRRKRLGVYVCGECGCPLSALSRQSEEICQNWKTLHP